MFNNRELEYIFDSICLEISDLEISGDEKCKRSKILKRLRTKIENIIEGLTVKEIDTCYYCFTELVSYNEGAGIDTIGLLEVPKVAADGKG